MTLWQGAATSLNMLQTCKNCGHRGDYHMNIDLQCCMRVDCECTQFDPAFVEKDESRGSNQDLIDQLTDIKKDDRISDDAKHDLSRVIARLLWDQA